MGLLDDVLADDAAFALSGDVMIDVETVTLVTTSGTTATTATISAQVGRLQAQDQNGAVVPVWEFVVRNDATYGILPSELRSAGSYIICALNKGESGASDKIYINDGAVSQDSGALMIRVDGQ